MCVIMAKPQGQNPPTDDTIMNMWETNSDGAGFMYTLNKRVYIEKGFMELKELMNAIAGLEKRLKKDGKELKDIPLIMHFRITTHGGTTRGNTHPYPVHGSSQVLQALDVYTDLGVAHNGVIHSVRPKVGESDTIEYIRQVLLPLAANDKDFLRNVYMRQLIENTIDGSRLAFLDKTGRIELLGNFETGTDGLFYSNLNHEWTYYGKWHNYSSKTKPITPKNTEPKLDLYSGPEYSSEIARMHSIKSGSTVGYIYGQKILTPVPSNYTVCDMLALNVDYTHLSYDSDAFVVGIYGSERLAVDDYGDVYVRVPEALSEVWLDDKGNSVEWMKSYNMDYAFIQNNYGLMNFLFCDDDAPNQFEANCVYRELSSPVKAAQTLPAEMSDRSVA